ncbi:hypothetical protein EV360DRAFT_76034, partial [Lentinula raphanica]
GHVKVWISYALFEAESIPVPRAMREEEEDEDAEPKMRVALLEVWKTFEETHGTADDVTKVSSMMPIVTKKRHVDQETGQMVEDWELVFADDERDNNPTSFKFLQMAHAWKNNQSKGGKSDSSTAPAPAPTKNNHKEDNASSDIGSSDEEN